GAGEVLFGEVDELGQRLAQGGEPLAVVDQLGELEADALFEVKRLLVEAELLQRGMALVKQGATGRFVDAVALHAYEPVLHDVDAADTVADADLVERLHDADGAVRHTVDALRDAFAEV